MEFLARTYQAVLAASQDIVLCTLAFAALAYIAGRAEAWRKARAAASEVRTNIALFAFDVIAVTPLIALMLAAMGAAIQHYWRAPIDWSLLPSALVALIAIFAGDFIAYWRHRLEHTDALWPAHAIHHSDTAMTWTTGLRFHPINRVTTAFIDTAFLALLGFPPWALIVNNLVRHYYGLFIHMDLPWTYGALGRVFVSPAMHRWHHVREAQGAGVNFATVFSVFDQAWRTYHLPGPCDVPLGVRDPVGAGPIAQLLWPFRALARWARAAYDARRNPQTKGTRMPSEIA